MCTFGGHFELKILRMRGFSSRFLDNQSENCCITKKVGEKNTPQLLHNRMLEARADMTCCIRRVNELPNIRNLLQGGGREENLITLLQVRSPFI